MIDEELPKYARTPDLEAQPGSPRPLTGLWVGTSHGDTPAEIPVSARFEAGKLVTTPSDNGFELRLRDGDAEAEIVRGHLVQPASRRVFSYPSATPVILKRDQKGWQGVARPLLDRVHFHLVIEEKNPGALTAYVREPGHNAGRFFGELTVVRSGSKLEFVRADRTAFTGDYDGDSIVVKLPELGGALKLVRGNRQNAPHFYPRPDNDYRYQPPPKAADGWPVASLEDVAIDQDAVTGLIEEIATDVPTSHRSPAIHSLLVARRGRLVLEEYFAGHRADEPHDTRSAGKSFATTLVGIAVGRGLLGVEDPVAKTMGGDELDRRKAAMQIKHLLTMTSGLECDDNDFENSAGNEDRMLSQDQEPDWHRYAWQLPMVREPGAAGVYCSAGINLLGGPLAAATGQWIPDFFATALADPLGIEHYHFNLMPTGQGYLGGGIRLRPRDFIKLGQLFADRGRWNGERVLSEEWTQEATAPHTGINKPDDYGYGWWRHTYDIGSDKLEAFYASGNGGQLIIVVPARALVISFMAGNYADASTWRPFRDELALRIVTAAN